MKKILPGIALLSSSIVTFAASDSRQGRQVVKLTGSVHRLARAEFESGAAPESLSMEHMLLMLQRTPAQQKELDALLERQQNPSSPDYHHWLTPDEFGERFGASQAAIATVSGWLESEGFHIDEVPAGRTLIVFSGTAGQVARSLHAEIRQYTVNGKQHWANNADPEIPAEFANVIAGIASLNNFRKHPHIRMFGHTAPVAANAGKVGPDMTFGGGTHALGPADYAVIYNTKPLLNAGVTGAGVSIAVLGRSNINVQDVKDFRSYFGLAANPPTVIVNGTNPGDLGGDEEGEAVLDNTWAGAVAPNASVKFIVSASTNASDGVDLSEQYAINHNVGDIITESFGTCEANASQAAANYVSSLAQQAASQGMSYFVSTGDSGSAGCDLPSESSETGGLSVSLLSSSWYTTAVGGTMFNEGSGTYWSATNGTNHVSALSHIPEKVWNESTPGLWSGGGGKSIYFQKPSWQKGVPGMPNDGSRDVPDVSLTAAGSHDPYLLCIGGSCSGTSTVQFSTVGGTSAAAPAFAGIMALIDQKNGGRQGNANPTLYKLATQQNTAACNGSSASAQPDASCVFNDVTVGNNGVPGEPNYNTTSATYQATTGYDVATGLGSVNAANLATAWAGGNTGGTGATTYYGLIGKQSGKALDVAGGSAAGGAQLVIATWTQSQHQEWQLVSVGTGYYEIVNRSSGLVITDPGSSTANATNQVQSAWTSGSNQIWQVIPVDSTYYRIVNKASGQVLNVYGAGTADGQRIIQWPWNGASNELWQLKAAQ